MPHEQLHQLFYGRPNDGEFFEIQLRDLARWRRLHELREHPTMKEPVGTMVNGQVVDWRTQAEANSEHLQQTLNTLAAFCRAALEFWKPETFEHIARIMRKIQTEKPCDFNPFELSSLPLKKLIRILVLTKKLWPINARRMAMSLENVPEGKPMTENQNERVETTRKNILDVCKALDVPTIGRGHPKKEN